MMGVMLALSLPLIIAMSFGLLVAVILAVIGFATAGRQSNAPKGPRGQKRSKFN